MDYPYVETQNHALVPIRIFTRFVAVRPKTLSYYPSESRKERRLPKSTKKEAACLGRSSGIGTGIARGKARKGHLEKRCGKIAAVFEAEHKFVYEI